MNEDSLQTDKKDKKTKNPFKRYKNPLKILRARLKSNKKSIEQANEQAILEAIAPVLQTSSSAEARQNEQSNTSTQSTDYQNNLSRPKNAEEVERSFEQQINESSQFEQEWSKTEPHENLHPKQAKQATLELMLNRSDENYLKAATTLETNEQGEQKRLTNPEFSKVNQMLIDVLPYVPNETPKNQAFVKDVSDIEKEREIFAVKIQAVFKIFLEKVEEHVFTNPELARVYQDYINAMSETLHEDLARKVEPRALEQELQKLNQNSHNVDLESQSLNETAQNTRPEETEPPQQDHYKTVPSSTTLEIQSSQKRIVKDVLHKDKIQSTSELPTHYQLIHQNMTNLSRAIQAKELSQNENNPAAIHEHERTIRNLVTELHALNTILKEDTGITQKNIVDKLIDHHFADLAVKSSPNLNDVISEKRKEIAVGVLLEKFNVGSGNKNKMLNNVLHAHMDNFVKSLLSDSNNDLQSIQAAILQKLNQYSKDLNLAAQGILRKETLDGVDPKNILWESIPEEVRAGREPQRGVALYLKDPENLQQAKALIDKMIKNTEGMMPKTEATVTQTQHQVQSVSQLRTSTHQDKPQEPSTRMKSK